MFIVYHIGDCLQRDVAQKRRVRSRTRQFRRRLRQKGQDRKGNLLYADKTRADSLLPPIGVQFPKASSITGATIGSNPTIPQPPPPVNSQNPKNQNNYKTIFKKMQQNKKKHMHNAKYCVIIIFAVALFHDTHVCVVSICEVALLLWQVK
jgi:hypothetical protein